MPSNNAYIFWTSTECILLETPSAVIDSRKLFCVLAVLISFRCLQAVSEAQERVRVKDRTNKERQDIKRRESQRQINNYITRSLYIHRNNAVRLTRSCQMNSTNTLQAKPRILYILQSFIYFRPYQWYYEPVHCTLVLYILSIKSVLNQTPL